MPFSDSFEHRYGYRPPPKTICIREDAPKSLRQAILDIGVQHDWGPAMLREVICYVLRVRPNLDSWTEYPNIWEETQDLIYKCYWSKVYVIIEELHGRMVRSPRSLQPDEAGHFAFELNTFFVEEGVGWQLINGEILTRGDDAFEKTVYTAEEELGTAGRATAAGRIKKAVQDLSVQPKPDTSGAVSHATSAMECVLGDITGEHMTLGDFLKTHPELFPGSMKKGLEGLWGYASNEGARHGREGVEPSREDAEFVVAIAAAITTYLSRKYPRL